MRGRHKITSSQNTTHADFWTLFQEKMNLILLLTVRYLSLRYFWPKVGDISIILMYKIGDTAILLSPMELYCRSVMEFEV